MSYYFIFLINLIQISKLFLMINDILSGIPWGIFLGFMLVLFFLYYLETSITKGFRAALVFDLGVVFADFVFILLLILVLIKLKTS